MSGWIKMGVGLRRHPKVVRIMSALKADRLRVVGALHAVWCVFDEHSSDGFLAGYSMAVMDAEIGWPGFSAAMQAVGWLQEDRDGLTVPDYEAHNGPTAKRRATDTSRKGKSRKGGQRSADCPQEDSPQSGQVSASDADKVRNRVEKSREEPIPSEAKASGAEAPPPSARERVFGLGIPILTAAGATERGARSVLGQMVKNHGDDAVADAIDRCAHAHPIEPGAWLLAALKTHVPRAAQKHTGFASKDYTAGVAADGSLA